MTLQVTKVINNADDVMRGTMTSMEVCPDRQPAIQTSAKALLQTAQNCVVDVASVCLR